MGKSSKDKRDAYYRLAKEQGWRARSAFKLIQLDEQFNLFDGATRVIDLCAAPGSWSQVLSRVLIRGEPFGRRAWEAKQQHLQAMLNTTQPEKMESPPDIAPSPRAGARIVAVDLQPMAALEGITTIVGDITHPSTIPRILQALDPDATTPEDPSAPSAHPVDLVLSDGAPDVTGLHDFDIYIQLQLLFSALNLAIRVLKPGGKFVAKIFRGRDVDLIYGQMRCFFRRVHCAKPRSSRASSLEAFIVCEDFCMPAGLTLDGPVGLKTRLPQPAIGEDTKNKWKDGQRRYVGKDGTTIVELEPEEDGTGQRWIAPFVACGDLSAWDSDATYHLPKDRISLDPVQPPTAPPYKRALEIRRQQSGMYGKTKNVKS